MFTLEAALLAVAALSVSADRILLENSSRRTGPFGDLAGYEPSTRVTDLAILDLDQRSLEAQLSVGTDESFKKAENIYLNGGHAGAYAVLKLGQPLSESVSEGSPVLGLTTSDGDMVEGRVSGFFFAKERSVRVSYPVLRDPDDLEGRRGCRVGALKDIGEEATEGCYKPTGTISIRGKQYSYTYDILTDTRNHISLSSLGDNTMKEMDRPMDIEEFVHYYTYYLEANFGHDWVLGALTGTKVDYPGRGDADFSHASLKSRAEAVIMGSAYINAYMFVLRMMQLSLAKCKLPCSDECTPDDTDCVLCDNGAERAWDEAVALYTGSLEGERGESGNGQFIFNLANELCVKFGTCNVDNNELEGMSKANILVMEHFVTGQMLIEAGSCDRAEGHTHQIWKLMAVPLVQGLLRSAHIMDKKTQDSSIHQAEADIYSAQGATFAAAVLPRIHACNSDDAELLYGSMRIGTMYTDFLTIKSILETNYECLGLSCADIGGLLEDGTQVYAEGASPCTVLPSHDLQNSYKENTTQRSSPLAALLWSILTVTTVLICGCCIIERYTGRKEEISDACPHYFDGEVVDFKEESDGEFL
uniref:Uncharacterized protein n=1 Tax=Odontella aurita TaxID=265563 RepID=A0A7S4HQL1_9STRA|mmetsp:Transcript_13547/g.39501  ORF Transcript_13547/g.39501 Transcript_13547/m.39501 type:complete len:588 (+) Transcript_13547:79-1842(+)